jgi:hypothetical protein
MEECVKVKILFSQPNIPMFHHSILPWTFSSDIWILAFVIILKEKEDV